MGSTSVGNVFKSYYVYVYFITLTADAWTMQSRESGIFELGIRLCTALAVGRADKKRVAQPNLLTFS
jgi:hypothetical protein